VNEPRYLPVTELGMASLALIVAGGIYLASHIPNHVPLAPAIGLLAASALLLAMNMILLSRVKAFDWNRFWQVARWSLLAYVVIAGMIEYVFLHDHTKGGPLVILTLSLVVFAVHVPILVGFTVARFYDRDDPGAQQASA
jgi:hypothetical protein